MIGGVRVEFADIDPMHPGTAGRLAAQIRNFVDATGGRWHAEAAGSFEKHVRLGFVAGRVLGGHDGIEPALKAELAVNLRDHIAGRPTGDRHG